MPAPAAYKPQAERYQPFELQRSAHKALLIDGFIRALLYWSRRTGKTLWSVQQLVFSSMLRQGPYHIVFKEYQQAETVAWVQYLHTIPKDLIAKTDKSTLTITFHYMNGVVKFPPPIGEVTVEADYSKPPSSIRLLGSDKADAHRGGESLGMIFDEYQDQDPYGWDFVYKYFLATTNGWAVFMGTAKDDDPWNEMIDYAQADERWYFSKATWRENPLIKPEWIEVERKEAEAKGRLGAFLQETELIPFSQQGAVYPMFNKNIHVIKPEEVPKEGTDYIALDYGFAEGHPMAANFIRITRDDIWYQWDEIHDIGIHIDDLIAEIRMKLGDRQLAGIVADSARPDLIEYMQGKGMPVIPAPKKQNSVLSGIQLHSRRLQPKIQIIGGPKPNFYITANCKKTIYDYTHYRYKEVKENRHPQELPEKKFDDSCFVAGTMVATPTGSRPIETLKAGDYVTTPFGPSKVLGAGSSGIKPVKDYGVFVATPNHKILTAKGMVPVDTIGYNDVIWVDHSPQIQLSSGHTLTGYLIGAILAPQGVETDFIFNALVTRNLEARLGFSTETFGSSITGQFLQEAKSITRTATMITALNRLNSFLKKNMPSATLGEIPLLQNILNELENSLKVGMVVRGEELGTLSMAELVGSDANATLRPAVFVQNLIQLLSPVKVNTVIQTAKQPPLDDAEVFNLATEDGMYFANGVLVSNCDANRYLELWLKYGFQGDKGVPKSSVLKELGDYGI